MSEAIQLAIQQPTALALFDPPITAKPRSTPESTLVSILTDLAHGFTLHETAKSHGINVSTITMLAARDPVFCAHYARARDIGIDEMADRAATLAQEAYDAAPRDFSGRADPSAIQAAKITADNLKWIVARRAPKRWGDRVEVEHSGTVQVDIRAVVAQLTEEQLEVLKALRASVALPAGEEAK